MDTEHKEKKKMGRPTNNPKNYQTRIRMTQEEWDKLEHCSKVMSKTKTEIVNLGVDKIYNELK